MSSASSQTKAFSHVLRETLQPLVIILRPLCDSIGETNDAAVKVRTRESTGPEIFHETTAGLAL